MSQDVPKKPYTVGDYWLKGDTYPIKDEIKGWGGFFVWEKRLWRVNSTHPDDVVYKELKLLGCEMVPVVLDAECQNIQDILNR